MKRHPVEIRKLLGKLASASTDEQRAAIEEEIKALSTTSPSMGPPEDESLSQAVKKSKSKEGLSQDDQALSKLYAKLQTLDPNDPTSTSEIQKVRAEIKKLDTKAAKEDNRNISATSSILPRGDIGDHPIEQIREPLNAFSRLLKDKRWLINDGYIPEDLRTQVASVAESLPIKVMGKAIQDIWGAIPGALPKVSMGISEAVDFAFGGSEMKQHMTSLVKGADDYQDYDKATTAINLKGGPGRDPITGDFQSAEKAAKRKYDKDDALSFIKSSTADTGYEEWETPEFIKELQEEVGTTESAMEGEPPRQSALTESFSNMMTDPAEEDLNGWQEFLDLLGLGDDKDEEDEEDFTGSLEPESDYGFGSSKLDFNSGKGRGNGMFNSTPTRRRTRSKSYMK